ncbi:coenzyme F420-0:L-glutamate ligase [Candidatus Parcubacteria bacterium]|nr:coenzyme F420-0:L-glutamate ligase [Candidatus Parcubacteria bacterium]
MKVKTIKTRIFMPPKDDLLSFIKESFSNADIKEGSVVVVTSKIVAISQGRCVKIGKDFAKPELIKQEADFYIDKEKISGKISTLTIKDNILISSSGIDESNANGYYVLWPENPFEAAKQIQEFIKKECNIGNVGIIISDSHRVPLREGITGLGIAYHGFYPLRDYRGKKDIFGRPMKYSQTNIVDSLASAAVFLMGEGSEQMPIAIIEDVQGLEFTDKDFSKKDLLKTDMDEDRYNFFLKSNIWKKGK